VGFLEISFFNVRSLTFVDTFFRPLPIKTLWCRKQPTQFPVEGNFFKTSKYVIIGKKLELMIMFPAQASIRSVIEYLILLAIKKEERILSKDLIKILEIEFRDAWIHKAGTVHPILKRLEEKGLLRTIEEEKIGTKAPYEITKDGLEALEDTFEYFEKTTDFHDLILSYGAEQFEGLDVLDLVIKKMERNYLLIKNRKFETHDEMILERLLKLRGMIEAHLNIVNEKIRQSEEEDGFVEVKIR